MRILVTGQYDPNYNRTKILLAGLRQSRELILKEFSYKRQSKFDLQAFLKLEKEADWIYIPPFCHSDVVFIKKHSKKPIIFDPLISRYLTKVFDYKQVWRYSPRAVKNYYKDKIPFSKCHILLADTVAHAEYYAKTFQINRQKIKVLPIGVNTSDYDPNLFQNEKETDYFHVGFYGGFIPLQGVQNIVEAAKLLKERKDIKFTLIGNGFEFEKINNYVRYFQLNNIELKGWIDHNDLPKTLNQFDCCLGIFGNTKKSNLVIPNKIYHYAALGKPIITKQSPAISEVFEDQKNIILCSSKPTDIAKSILKVKDNIEHSTLVAKAAKTLMTKHYSQNHIATRFINFLEDYSIK